MRLRILSIRDRLPQLVVPDSGQRFAGQDFRSLRLPGVYMFLKDESVLYIGMSSCLLQRTGSSKHSQASKAIAQCDAVLLYPCRSLQATRILERELIRKINPPFNVNLRSNPNTSRYPVQCLTQANS